MPQLFQPGFTLILRLMLVGLLVFLIMLVMVWRIHSALTTASLQQIGTPLAQPVPFSHKHHVADVGLDCRYCHTSVENSSFAGMPATETCMTCHSQIWRNAPMLAPIRASLASAQPLRWNRVYRLPDYVYFDHSIHVHQGVGCATCHGRVDQMPLTAKAHALEMRWCLDCHRSPEKYLRPRNQVFNMAWQAPPNQQHLGRQLIKHYHINVGRLSDCSVCHR